VVAQAFHWFEGVSALREIHRVLRSGSALAVIWNVRDESVRWVAEMSKIFDRYERDVMRFWKGAWRAPFESTKLFTPLRREGFTHAQTLTRQGIVERVLSVSFIAALEQPEREAVAAEMLEVLDNDPLTKGNNEIAVAYRTELYWCNRLEPAAAIH